MTDHKETQIEGQPEKIRCCSKCNEKYDDKPKYCMSCGGIITLKNPQEIKSEFKQLLETDTSFLNKTLIYQYNENFVYNATVDEIKKIEKIERLEKSSKLDENFSIYIRIRPESNDNWTSIGCLHNSLHIRNPNNYNTQNADITHNEKTIFGIKYMINETKYLYTTLLNLISHEITNPIIRYCIYFKANKNFSELNSHEQVELKNISNMESNDGYPCSYSSFSLPRKIQTPTKEDIQLQELLSKICEDIFYSRKMRQLYTHDELIEIFREEGKWFKLNHFKEHSKHIKILNVNAYILNESIDGLFFFKEARKHTAKIKELERHDITQNLIYKLFGLE